MCGITFCLSGIDPSQLDMMIDIFQIYRNNHYTNNIDNHSYETYLEHILKEKLYISLITGFIITVFFFQFEP